MKIIKLLPVITVCICSGLHAQVYTKTTLNDGESINLARYYLFPSFTNGTVKFKIGRSLIAKMNFNLVLCAMLFIDENNDTLMIRKPEDIDSIIINNNVFFFYNGYHQVLASSGSVELTALRKATYEPLKVGALGLVNHSGAGTQTYSSLITFVGEKKLSVNEDIEVTSETGLFLTGDTIDVTRANKAGFLKVFSSKTVDIQNYLKQNKINFNKQADVIKLFNYCTE